ncbi:hypothetical protein HNP48_005688 [Acidovorax soli]|uniref:Restriction endonuclease n=1 Tax=Acidovorax soli TaxID=592050 RepID=A0A7X0PKB1_9BURK|nr:restriction endonuclease [Acidovorax soli]MBB6562971.1 hypothetical protein [Acidovorax soli]
MPNYNYDALSPQDFEEIARDLLQAEWGVAIEAFKSGRDGGIDLRYATSPQSSIVVQCKHYFQSGFAALLRHLKASELPKIIRVNPARYVLVTSVPLSPANKDAIMEALAPHIKSTADVIGVDDLDGLLARHPAVERSNFKLWLTSTSVLERIMHNAEICQTEFEVQRIRRKLPLFVQNNAYPRARQILDANRIIVISGAPGIGKTTLAELLLYSNLEEGYQPVVMAGDISEGKKLYRHEEKQVFYYDDFLGQTFLGDRRDYFGRNQDKAVVDFMEMVQSSPYSRFILTTREHILGGAIQLSERLNSSTVVRDRVVLELGDYNFGDRARMVYNHLYFSTLSRAHKDEMLRDKFYLHVIKHPHFNPRLIEWLASLQRVNDVAPPFYQQFVKDLLRDPTKIWGHAFRNDIPESGKSLLLVLYTVYAANDVKEFEVVFNKFHSARAEKYHFKCSPLDFKEALRLLEGAFVVIDFDNVDFLNPSVKDYVSLQISETPEIFDDLLNSAVRFEQVVALWRLVKAKPELRAHPNYNSRRSLILEKIAELLSAPHVRWSRSDDGQTIGFPIDAGRENRLAFLADFFNDERSQHIKQAVFDAMGQLIDQIPQQGVNFWRVPDLIFEWAGLEWFVENGGDQIRLRLLEKLLLALPNATAGVWRRMVDFPGQVQGWRQRDTRNLNKALRYYKEIGWREEWDSCGDYDERQDIIDNLTELVDGGKWRHHFSEALETLRVELANYSDDADEPDEGEGAPIPTANEIERQSMSEDEVRNMFQTLLPSE